ncbi:MAG: hypothetical protein HYS39_00910 [Proteobacteria bacterium]|nr:hypothetical protein [Pseudomonadota bacterium]
MKKILYLGLLICALGGTTQLAVAANECENKHPGDSCFIEDNEKIYQGICQNDNWGNIVCERLR